MKYLIEIQYRGGRYYGWQKQPGVETISSVLERHISAYMKQVIVLYGASRTDRGVHARQQFAHFEAEKQMDFEKFSWKFLHSLNAMMKLEEIAIKRIVEVKEEFHARHSCVNKVYKYRMKFLKYKDPFAAVDHWIITGMNGVDLTLVNRLAKELVGVHDFSSFRSGSCQALSPVRFVEKFEFYWENDSLVAELKGKSFLQHQIRIMVGTIITLLAQNAKEVKDSGEQNVDEIVRKLNEILNARDRSMAKIKAPAHGLTLEEVRYAKY